MKIWMIVVKTRCPTGGWWNVPIGASFDPVPALGPPPIVRGSEYWYSTQTDNIFITAELMEFNHEQKDLDHPVQHPDEEVCRPSWRLPWRPNDRPVCGPRGTP